MLEHELQSLTRHSHQLQALRRESTGLWTDDLAHTLALHYLNPHQQRDEALRSALADQLTALHEAEAHRAQAEQYALDAEHRSARVRERLESAQADTSAAWRACDLHAEYEANVRTLLPRVRDYIDRANRACD